LEAQGVDGRMGSEWILGRLAGGGVGIRLEWFGQGPVTGCCECGDETSGSCATELVIRDEIHSNCQRNRKILKKRDIIKKSNYINLVHVCHTEFERNRSCSLGAVTNRRMDIDSAASGVRIFFYFETHQKDKENNRAQ
jgi:hypothetical protein